MAFIVRRKKENNIFLFRSRGKSVAFIAVGPTKKNAKEKGHRGSACPKGGKKKRALYKGGKNRNQNIPFQGKTRLPRGNLSKNTLKKKGEGPFAHG